MARRYPKHYARAVFQIALERQELERWESDLGNIASLGEDATVIAFLENPRFHFEDKTRLLSARLADVNPLALNLLYLLMARGRLSMISQLAAEYQRLLDDYRGIQRAVVRTAVPLDETEQSKLRERLGALLGKRVVLKSEVDSSVIGGFVAKAGYKLIDGSLRSRLLALKRELGGAE